MGMFGLASLLGSRGKLCQDRSMTHVGPMTHDGVHASSLRMSPEGTTTLEPDSVVSQCNGHHGLHHRGNLSTDDLKGRSEIIIKRPCNECSVVR